MSLPADIAGLGGDASASRLVEIRHDLFNRIGHISGFAEMMLEETDSAVARVSLERVRQIAAQMLEGAAACLDPQKARSQQIDAAALRHVRQLAGDILASIGPLQASPENRPMNAAFGEDLARIEGAAQETTRLVDEALSALARSGSVAPAALSSDTVFWTARDDPSAASSSTERKAGLILVVDDLAANRELLTRRLARIGYATRTASCGREALETVASTPVDLILLDVAMPDMDGLEVLRRLKQNPITAGVPVVMLSASDQIDNVVHCIQLGAEDFLPKPFNPVLLLARIESSLSKKRLRDKETQFLQRLQREQDRSERLLLNILPPSVAERLKQGEKNIADSFAEVTVLFSDFVGFTQLSSLIPPKELVSQLNAIFSAFDHLCAEHGLEKIKTIGDAFMAVAGLPGPLPEHACAAADLALAMQIAVADHAAPGGGRLRMRIGLNTGPVVAGVIGARKFAYDIWGDTVNVASRMEQLAPAGGILVSRSTRDLLGGNYRLEARGRQSVKGKGRTATYLLLGRREARGGPAVR